ACMGATFPFAMLAIKGRSATDSGRSFSYLYVANVLGAVSGSIVPLFLIELLGFHRTLYVGACLNLLLAACAFALSLRQQAVKAGEGVNSRQPRTDAAEIGTADAGSPRMETVRSAGARTWTEGKLLWLLFATGLTSMGAEIVWIRIYTPPLGTVVYAFASILATYLGATYLGSRAYRVKGNRVSVDNCVLWMALGFSVLFPFFTADFRVPLPAVLRMVLGVTPFSGLVGFLTPMIVDQYSLGDPDRAGKAYAVNIVGCVIGPLVSGFVLLPWIGERLALCAFALPWFAVGLVLAPQSVRKSPRSLVASAMLVIASLALSVSTKGYAQQY